MPFLCVTIPDYDNDESDDEIEIKLPATWGICGQCRGEGHHCGHLGAITQDEFSQWHSDEVDMYFSGGYDKTCETCDGAGKVLEVDVAACERNPKYKRALELYRLDGKLKREMDAESEAERRFGC